MKRLASITKYSGLVAVILVVAVRIAIAGTAGTEFTQLYDLLEGWTTGMLGKSIALAAFLVGMGFSVVQQSLVPVAIGIGAAASLAYTPEVLSGIITTPIF